MTPDFKSFLLQRTEPWRPFSAVFWAHLFRRNTKTQTIVFSVRVYNSESRNFRAVNEDVDNFRLKSLPFQKIPLLKTISKRKKKKSRG